MRKQGVRLERPQEDVSRGDRAHGLDLSIVVVTWNTRDLLSRCLSSVNECLSDSSLQHADRLSHEVIVVDNHSADGTSEMVREKFSWVRLIRSEINLGFARGNNVALRRHRGRYVLLLNPDTEVRPGALQSLVRYMDTHRDVGAVGPLVLNPNGTLQVSCYPLPNLPREIWRLFHGDAVWPYGVYNMDSWSRTEPRSVDVLQGACLLVRQEALEDVGPLDEDFFIYSEEVDLCKRIRERGWNLKWIPDATIVHHGGQSTGQLAEEMFLFLYRGKMLYFRKHFGAGAERAYKVVLVFAAWLRLALTPLTSLTDPDVYDRRQTTARYYRRLVREIFAG